MAMNMSLASERQRSSGLSRILILAVIALLLIGVGLFAASRLIKPVVGTAAPADTSALNIRNAQDAPALSVAAAPAQAGANDQLLVWTAKGAAPGKESASDPGQLVSMDGTGVTTPVMDVPPQTSRVEACGDRPTSPDGKLFAFYVGLDAGKLYLKSGSDAPKPVADVNALACLGNGTFQYSPDSSKLAYIAYEPDAIKSEFADGFLHVVNTSDLSEAYKYENVTAFAMNNSGVAFVSFFTNDKHQADEAGIEWWNGSGQQKEVATLDPVTEDCRYTSAAINILPDGKFLLIIGSRCTKGNTHTSWQLYSIDPDARSATLAGSDYQDGQFAAFARTNNVFLSPDGSHAYFTVPDGITNNTVGVKMVSLSDLSLSDLLDKQGVMATYNGAADAFPRVSPDGKWLAAVVTSPNSENQVEIWNLSDSTIAPIILKAGSKGDTISSMAFTPDSTSLVVVAGGDNNADNSLIGIDLSTGNDTRIARGHFGPGLTISPDGKELAITDWQIPEDTKQPPYLNTEIVDVGSGNVTTIYTGATITDGKVTNQTFALPLDWVKTG